MVDVAVSNFAGIDILFNNAGIYMEQTAIEDIEESLWDRILTTNVKSIYLAAKYTVPVMKKAGGGIIINTASMVGQNPPPYLSPYAASKAAVIALTRSLAHELLPSRIRVNCICPSLVETPMVTSSREWKHASSVPRPLGRMIQPEDIAKTAMYLASDEAAMVSGISINVNGGQGG
jgi:3-oxoacyl-[acyl-carrier protein] reductase